MLVNMLEDRALVKSIASADKDCYDAAAGGVESEEGVSYFYCTLTMYVRKVMFC